MLRLSELFHPKQLSQLPELYGKHHMQRFH